MKNKYYGCSIVFLVAAILSCCCDAWMTLPRSLTSPQSVDIRRNMILTRTNNNRHKQHNMIGTGFSFEDSEQILVSIQKPFGIILEQDSDAKDERIIVMEIDPMGSAGRAGVQIGDVLVAVQNASTVSVDLAEVLDFISNKCPRVVNLRFRRMTE